MASVSSNEISIRATTRIDGHRRGKQRSLGRFQPLGLTCRSFWKIVTVMERFLRDGAYWFSGK